MEHEIGPRHQGVRYVNDFGSDTNHAIARLLGWPMYARAAQLQRELHEQAAMYGLI